MTVAYERNTDVSGINEFDGANWGGMVLPENINFAAANLVYDGDDSVWVIGQENIYMYDGMGWEYFNANNTPVEYIHQHIAVSPDGREIWVAYRSGIMKIQRYPLAGQLFLPIMNSS